MENAQNDSRRCGSFRRMASLLVVGLCTAAILLLLSGLVVCTNLRDAAAQGHLKQMRMLLHLAPGPWMINSTNRYGYGSMQLAAQNGHPDVLALLIEHGGNVNLRRPSSWNTPLIMAASRGRVDCCRLLLDKGADPNEFGLFGGTRHTALQCAAERGHLEVVNLFLDRGIGPNEQQGSTSALHRACKEGQLDVVKRLVWAGANINSTQEWKGNTPLQFAVKYEHSEVAAFLRQAGAAEGERRRETECRQFDAINASVKESDKEIVVEVYIPDSARFVVDSNGIHWESRNWEKPGTNFGQKRNDPTYINGIAWYPRWSTGIYEKALDRSEPCPVRIPLEGTIHFELLGVGESRDSYAMKACPRIKTYSSQDSEFAVMLAGTEIRFRWCRFRLSWER